MIYQKLLRFSWSSDEDKSPFLINAHAKIEKLIAKIRLIAWKCLCGNYLMEIISFGTKHGVEDLLILPVYPIPFSVFGSTFPRLLESPKYHKASILNFQMVFTHLNQVRFLFKYFGWSVIFFSIDFLWWIISIHVELEDSKVSVQKFK